MAAGHSLTAEAAANVLREGGNAVDAAISALAMACLTEPILCSPGGGGFAMLRYAQTGAVSLIDFFPQTPKGRRVDGSDGVTEIFADFGTATQAFHIGPATTATPGFVDGLGVLHRAGASMPLTDLIQPAVEAARRGITISAFQHYLGAVVRPIITANQNTGALFAPDGDPLTAGATFTNPGLADALEMLAVDGFSGSAVGAALLALQEERGHLREPDLEGYRAIERLPLSLGVGNCTVHLNPLPSATGTLIAHSLGWLESTDPLDIARAFNATDAARRNPSGELAGLDQANLRQQGTTHVSVIDEQGNACAVTTSNGSGNGELVGEFGFMPNNILGEDDVNPAGAAGWPLDSRLASGMCPTLIEQPDGALVALGSGGSNRIRTAICQVIIQLCREHSSLQEAVAAPRIHVEDGHLDFEDFFAPASREELTAAFGDHRAWPEPNLFFGGVHAARVDRDGVMAGIGDARRDGTAIVVR